MNLPYLEKVRRWYVNRNYHRSRRDPPLRDPIFRHLPLPGQVTPMTAGEAYRLIEATATVRDPNSRLTMIVCNESITPAGRAFLWELWFDLPDLRARGHYRIEIAEGMTTNVTTIRAYFDERLTPFVTAGDLLDRMLSAGRISEHTVDSSWDQDMALRPPLPAPFLDSPEAVAMLTAQGAIFAANDRQLTLVGKWTEAEAAVWETVAEGKIYRIPFARHHE